MRPMCMLKKFSDVILEPVQNILHYNAHLFCIAHTCENKTAQHRRHAAKLTATTQVVGVIARPICGVGKVGSIQVPQRGFQGRGSIRREVGAALLQPSCSR